MIEVVIPLKTQNEANSRDTAWRGRHRRSKNAHRAVALVMSQFDPKSVKLPAVVRLTRMSFGELDDDGLRSAMKYVRDAVALWIGIDDKDVVSVMYQYAQGFAPRKTYAVKIEVFGGYRLREEMVPARPTAHHPYA